MTIKKSLFALGTAATVAIAGAGVANAANDDTSNPGDTTANGSSVLGSIQESTSDGALDPSGSIDAGGFFNQIWADGEEGVISLAGVVTVVAGIATFAGTVGDIAKAYDAVVGASDTFQGVVSDTIAFLQSQGLL